MKLRVGLIGLGEAWQQRHRSALFALRDRFEVVAICEEVAHLAEQAAREFNATRVDGFRSLVSRDDIEAVVILSPQWYGTLPILAACDAGKSIYCAAGLDLELAEAQNVSQRVERAGIAFIAELPRRHAPATLRLKELIATRLGKPKLLFCHHRQPVGKSNASRHKIDYGALVTRALMEQVDWCRYVVGEEPTSVVGVGHRATPDSHEDDYQMMSLDFSPTGETGVGPVAQISCGHYMPVGWPEAIAFRPPAALQVCCENGIAFIDLPATLTWFDSAGRHQESLDSERPVGEQMLRYFHRAVTSLVRRTSDLTDAFQALSVVQAARESQQQGRRMKIERWGE
jgi:predicted dehydrogenase